MNLQVIDLRDWFAGQVLPVIIAKALESGAWYYTGNSDHTDASRDADEAYNIADAMMKRRNESQ